MLTLRGKFVDHVNQISRSEHDERPRPDGFQDMDSPDEKASLLARRETSSNPRGGLALFNTLFVDGTAANVAVDQHMEAAMRLRIAQMQSFPPEIMSSIALKRPSLHNWILLNANFSFSGHRLFEWLGFDGPFDLAAHERMQQVPDSYYYSNPRNLFQPDVLLPQTERRRLIAIQKQRIGWADWDTQFGDEIWLLLGCTVPVIPRQRYGGGYHLVGDSCVYGAMDGELMADDEPEVGSKWTDVDIY
ncbi:uncharacterized protein BDZ99DRAFT_521417 [Mytilinidion resinicola]|uniref:Uncharacterized protein n=1 Tax=Mytilinidion resinicola TaxID=574789 RepID=A0A6A6YM56_9PEZI|nr:uncharacterized protein BDZ99DRAFT_521417 [Mytilinidion resinicola]KAF2808947.1 hypothetical protein BDZ99DRAFT_521417 [Mytilinidion resinicola]